MGNTEVSVIIPAYNAAQYLTKAIESVLMQEVRSEIILIDDASTDSIAQTIKKYREFNQITYIRNAHNIGVAESRNLGVATARSPYVAFLDADDWWEPGKLKTQLKIIKETGTAFTYTGRKIHYRGMEQEYRVPSELTYQDLLKCNYIACSSVLMDRQMALRYPMSSEQGIHEDYLTWLQIVKKAGKIYGISDCYLNYVVHGDSRSGSKIRSLMMRVHTYRKAGLSRAETLKFNVGYYGKWIAGLRKETV